MDVARVETMIGYHCHDPGLITQALRAPSKLQDKETGTIVQLDDGNRKLAQLGHKVLELVLMDQWYRAGSDRGILDAPSPWYMNHTLIGTENIQDTINKLVKGEYLANIAKGRGLDTCIACCERQGDSNPSPKTLKLAVTAVVAAVWLDSDRNLDAVSKVVEQLRIVTLSDV